jgi:hypothetical protein
VELNIYVGMFLADLNADLGPSAASLLPRPVSALIIFVGLYIASFPEEHPDWRSWSHSIELLAQHFIPDGAELNRHVVSIGTTLIVYGVFFSRDARHLLSNPAMNFLGRISFPVYLLHNTLMRTVLAWLIYGRSAWKVGLDSRDREGNPLVLERGGFFTFAIGIPIFYAVLLATAYLWTVYVDPLCEKLVSWLAKKAFSRRDTGNDGLIGTPPPKETAVA